MSQRARLLARRPATEPVRLPADPDRCAAAARAVDAAERALYDAEQRGAGPDRVTALSAAVAAARLELERQPVETIVLRPLPAPEWDELVDAHPPTDEQRAQGWDYDAAGMRPALLAAAVVTPDGDDPLTVDDWAELIARGGLGAAEVNLLHGVAAALQTRAPRVSTGKG